MAAEHGKTTPASSEESAEERRLVLSFMLLWPMRPERVSITSRHRNPDPITRALPLLPRASQSPPHSIFLACDWLPFRPAPQGR